MVAILIVRLNNTQKIGKIGFGGASISIAILVYLETIKIKMAVYFRIPFCQILLPIHITRYLQINITCP